MRQETESGIWDKITNFYTEEKIEDSWLQFHRNHRHLGLRSDYEPYTFQPCSMPVHAALSTAYTHAETQWSLCSAAIRSCAIPANFSGLHRATRTSFRGGVTPYEDFHTSSKPRRTWITYRLTKEKNMFFGLSGDPLPRPAKMCQKYHKIASIFSRFLLANLTAFYRIMLANFSLVSYIIPIEHRIWRGELDKLPNGIHVICNAPLWPLFARATSISALCVIVGMTAKPTE